MNFKHKTKTTSTKDFELVDYQAMTAVDPKLYNQDTAYKEMFYRELANTLAKEIVEHELMDIIENYDWNRDCFIMAARVKILRRKQ